jgi:alpha-1,2-mannosyltransferase
MRTSWIIDRLGRPSSTKEQSGKQTAPQDHTRTVIAIGALIAAAVTLYQLSRPGALFGATADIAVYLGGSIRLVHGALPYRDFVYVEPPGFVLLATPFAFLSELIGTRDAIAILRLCTPVVAVVSVVLVGRLVRRRGVAATLIACGVMALFPAQLYALHSVLLEPLLELCWLWGATLVFDGDGFAAPRQLAAGGALFGFAVSVKLSAIIPLLVVLVVCLPQLRRRAVPFAAGALAGGAIPTLPFLVMAPAAMYRDVVATQLGRIPASGRVPLPIRLGDITGASAFASGDTAAIAAAIAFAGLVAAAFILSRRRPAPFEWFALGSIAALAVAQLVPGQYYPHYAAVLAPFLAILVAVSLGRLRGRRAPTLSLAIAAGGVAVLLAGQIAYLRGVSTPDVVGAVDSVVPAGGCAVSDAPRNLVTADRFVATASGCTNMTDPAGTMLALDDTREASGVWDAVFDRVDYVVTETPIRSWSVPGDASAYVAEHFRLVRSGGLFIYVRTGFAAG